MRANTAALAALSMALSAAAQPSVPGCDLFDDGGFFIGCNYWARNAGMYMWSKWRPDVIEREIAELAKYGVSVMRVFPLWPDFQPLTGDCRQGGLYRSFRFRENLDLPNEAGVDDEMVGRFAWFADCAERHGVRLIVALVTGHMSSRSFVPCVFEERNVLSDPAAVMWQAKFVKYFVGRLRSKKAIAAWDLGNECNCLGAEAGREMFYNWMNHIAMTIRLADPSRPVVSGMHSLSTRESDCAPIRLNGELMDVLCTHPYQFYVPGCGMEAFNTMRTELHPTAESLLYRDLGGKPCFIEEIGNMGTSCVSEGRTAAGMRVTLFSAWANDLKGCLWWCNSDQEALDFPPYCLTPNERELGLLRQDYSPKPLMLEMQSFQRFRESLPFARLPARCTNAVIVVPEKSDGWIAGFGAYILCRQAGIDPVFAGAERRLPDAPLYVVCSADEVTSYTLPAQRRIFDRVHDGGAVALVLYSARNRFTFLREISGAEVDYCTRSPVTRRFEYMGKGMECRDSWTCRLIARECETLARTTEGEPVFTSFALGRGKVLLVNSPVDREAVLRTDVASGKSPQAYYEFFRKAVETAGIRLAVEKGDCPQVGITEHPAADGTTVCIAINFEPRSAECPIRLNGRLGRVWRGVVSDGAIRLPPNDAAVFEVIGGDAGASADCESADGGIDRKIGIIHL